MSEPPRKRRFVQSKLSLVEIRPRPPAEQSLPVDEDLVSAVEDKPPPLEDRDDEDNTTRRRKTASVLQTSEETVSSSTEASHNTS